MDKLTILSQNSGIFGYLNYLVEKDRKFIIDTLLNGELDMHLIFTCVRYANNDLTQASSDSNTVATTPLVSQ